MVLWYKMCKLSCGTNKWWCVTLHFAMFPFIKVKIMYFHIHIQSVLHSNLGPSSSAALNNASGFVAAWLQTTDLNNTGSRTQWPEVKPKKLTNFEYQDGMGLVLRDVSASYEQCQKEVIATKA